MRDTMRDTMLLLLLLRLAPAVAYLPDDPELARLSNLPELLGPGSGEPLAEGGDHLLVAPGASSASYMGRGMQEIMSWDAATVAIPLGNQSSGQRDADTCAATSARLCELYHDQVAPATPVLYFTAGTSPDASCADALELPEAVRSLTECYDQAQYDARCVQMPDMLLVVEPGRMPGGNSPCHCTVHPTCVSTHSVGSAVYSVGIDPTEPAVWYSTSTDAALPAGCLYKSGADAQNLVRFNTAGATNADCGTDDWTCLCLDSNNMPPRAPPLPPLSPPQTPANAHPLVPPPPSPPPPPPPSPPPPS
ncbi:MAG: hypothetical protein ACKVI4_18195, partial [Actinomycetales bacterium]